MGADFRNEFRNFVRDAASITNYTGDRVFWQMVPANLSEKPNEGYPFIVLTVISGNIEHHTRGAAPLANSNVQATVWAKSTAQMSASRMAWTVADQLRLLLDGYHGPMGRVTVHSSRLTLRFDTAEQPQDGSDRWVLGVIQEFSVWHGESVPALAT